MPTLPGEEWDGEFVVTRRDPPTGAVITIAVHRSRPVAAVGGTRMKAYGASSEALDDARRLSGAMSLKFAVLGIPRGGGKAVIDVPGDLGAEDRRGLLLRYGDLIASLRGIFQTGPDLGTTPEDMDLIAERTGHVFGRTSRAGGGGDPGPFTARGVFEGIRAALDSRFGSPEMTGRRILVQGLGGVGRPLAEMLSRRGAHLIVTDVDRSARAGAERAGWHWIAPDSAPETECDVLSPCAVGGVLDERTIPRLRCAIVAGAANNQLASPEGAGHLARRGILYAPDFVINGGGAIRLFGAEKLGWTRRRIDREIRGIGTRLAEIFARARRDGITTLEAALRLAEPGPDAPGRRVGGDRSGRGVARRAARKKPVRRGASSRHR